MLSFFLKFLVAIFVTLLVLSVSYKTLNFNRFTLILVLVFTNVLLLSMYLFKPSNKKNIDRVMKICISPDYPPFCYINKGKPAGIDIDILEEVAKKMGYETQYTILPFDVLFQGIRNKEFHVAAGGLSYTQERSKQITFSDSYIHINHAILIIKKKKQDVISGNLTIGVQYGSVFTRFINKILPQSFIKETTDALLLLEELKQDKIDAILADAIFIIDFYKTLTEEEKEQYILKKIKAPIITYTAFPINKNIMNSDEFNKILLDVAKHHPLINEYIDFLNNIEELSSE